MYISFVVANVSIVFISDFGTAVAVAVAATDTMWDPVMKAVPKVDENESGQMVLK